MTAFGLLPPAVRAVFALWALFLCLTNIGNAILAAVRKRYGFTVFALILLAPVYFMWQVIFDIILFGKTDKITRISEAAGELALPLWLAAFGVLTFSAVFLLYYNIKYDKNFITPGAIKVFLDGMPCGICCFRDNGMVLFSNVCMNRLCVTLTGSPLLNGVHFRDAVSDGIFTLDGKVWRFSCRDMVFGGQTLHEMIASDVTSEYAKTQTLEKDKAELSRLNRELKEYNLSIDDTVRRREILQAKVKIHDEMNRLMLSTAAAESDDTAELDRIFSLWEKNALLLCMEADDTADAKAAGRIDRLADALKIRLTLHGDLPPALSEKQRSLFFSATQEAIANAAKHAKAKNMDIYFTETETHVCCTFVNDGEMPEGGVRFTGGLANLALLSKRQGADISANVGEKFILSLNFLKNS